MNQGIERMLLENGASMVGFADLRGLYTKVDPVSLENGNTTTGTTTFPNYPGGISIVLAYPKEIIKDIDQAPTMDYFNAYHELNQKLDYLADLCAEYIQAEGYHAYPQKVALTKQFGNYRTVMPHKTVAVHAGMGWIGKSALFITEKYGSALRLTSVLTDAPLVYKNTITYSKCGGCMLCKNACPGHAISGLNWSPELDRDEFFDALACRKKARELSARTLNKEITLCGKCIEICPYTNRYLNS